MMKLLIDGKLYDYTKTPVLLIFDESEKEIFGYNPCLSAPKDSTEEERKSLIETEI